jgi:hypothetical protein
MSGERICAKCELPKDACACADAKAYDRWWATEQGRIARQKDHPHDPQ